MAANIHRTFCFTDSSLLQSFTQEFRSQLAQVSAWDFWCLQVAAVLVHTLQPGVLEVECGPTWLRVAHLYTEVHIAHDETELIFAQAP